MRAAVYFFAPQVQVTVFIVHRVVARRLGVLPNCPSSDGHRVHTSFPEPWYPCIQDPHRQRKVGPHRSRQQRERLYIPFFCCVIRRPTGTSTSIACFNSEAAVGDVFWCPVTHRSCLSWHVVCYCFCGASFGLSTPAARRPSSYFRLARALSRFPRRKYITACVGARTIELLCLAGTMRLQF